jgi:hypothetical protein
MRLTAIVAVFLAALPALAIVRRDDRPDARYVALAKQFPAAAILTQGGSGVLIAPQWVLTAGHAANDRSALGEKKVIIAGEAYGIAGYVRHPQFQPGTNDVGLVKLDRPVRGVQPLPLYGGVAPLGTKTLLVGAGLTGTGTTGINPNRGERVLRAATNILDKPSGNDKNLVSFVFDKGQKATDMEGIGAPGDSGGPALIQVGGRWHVVAVGTAGDDRNGNRVMADYGDSSNYTRVAPFKSWIESTIKRGEVTTKSASNSAQPWEKASNNPACAVAGEFFRAYNAGVKAMERFDAARRPGRSPEQTAAMHQRMTGDFGATLTPFEYVLTPDGIHVRARGSAGSGTFRFVVRDGKVEGLSVLPGR